MGKKARVRQLKEVITGEHIDIVGVQETIKKNFYSTELEGLTPGKGFSWNWVAAKSHSGGGGFF
jgi:hypothetical protein